MYNTRVALVFYCVIGALVEGGIIQPRFFTNYEDTTRMAGKNTCDCACGINNNRQMRVVGGNVSKANEFPWIAGLSQNGEFYCGATIITKRHLLTAAHCVHGFNRRTISVALGDHDRKDKNRFSKIQVNTIKKIHAHKLFEASSYNNDIAILELNEPIVFNSWVQPACLPDSALVDYTGRLAIVAGWGRTGEKKETSTVLRKVAVKIWSKKSCYNSDYGEERLSENMFCAGYEEGQKDACQGDSGGPLNIERGDGNMEVIGIVSWGRGCARPKLPGIYTKLVNYLDWLNEILDDECLCSPIKQNPRRARR